jgi:hypothetical protein
MTDNAQGNGGRRRRNFRLYRIQFTAIGATVGAVVGYFHPFDELSRGNGVFTGLATGAVVCYKCCSPHSRQLLKTLLWHVGTFGAAALGIGLYIQWITGQGGANGGGFLVSAFIGACIALFRHHGRERDCPYCKMSMGRAIHQHVRGEPPRASVHGRRIPDSELYQVGWDEEHHREVTYMNSFYLCRNCDCEILLDEIESYEPDPDRLAEVERRQGQRSQGNSAPTNPPANRPNRQQRRTQTPTRRKRNRRRAD